ncbi:hypothetical protein RZO55_07200 [Clostridium boliviensis]|uniref:DUF5316 domain-containing protein n=1 Tax=Clostridium boliviensis TaxID=318465 RepID=A0ABU4GK41_9CLOT|nr:hypothetical protein [Clostridium boliviensis]
MKYSSLASMVLVVISGIFGLILSGGNLLNALECIKAVLFAVGSIGLIIGAVSILRKDREKDKDWSEWKKRFEIFTYRVTVIIMSIIVLLYGCISDEFLFMLNH